MASPGRRPDPPLEQILLEEPYRFDFFQAVRVLGRLRPDRAPIGRAEHPRREVARFRVRQGLAFPPSPIHEITPVSDPDGPHEMAIAFLGLTGPSGVLPHAYSELVEDRGKAGDRTLAAFFDIFGHRMASLFFRAWEKHHVVVTYELGEFDRFGQYLFDLIGLGISPLQRRLEFDDEALLFHSGVMAQRRRPAVMLEALLREIFELDVAIQQFWGAWLPLGDADRSSLGISGAYNCLGTSFVVGQRVWDEQGRFRLRIGPMGFDAFLRFQPDSAALRSLAHFTRLFVGPEFDFDVQLVLRAEEVPGCTLTSTGGPGARLGRHAWLKSHVGTTDADDAVFRDDGKF